MPIVKYIFLFTIALIVIAGCKKADEYSDIPSIGFKSLSVQKNAGSGFDSIAHLVVSFTDGDGDIGTVQYDGVPNNFIINLFEKNNGIWNASSTSLSGHLPYLTPRGNNKALKGEIEHDIFLPFGKIKDTLRYEIFIFDRALHKSNTVTTSEIVITTN